MSYDIICYKSNLGRPDVDEASQVIEDDNDIWVKKPYNYQTKTAIEKALLGFDTNLQGFDYADLAKKKNKSIDDVKKDFQKFELNTIKDDPEIHVEIFDYHVAITIPYLYQGDMAKKVFEKLKAYIKIIKETAGYFVYDPQTGETYDPIGNKFDGIRKYLSVSDSMDDILKSARQPENKKPWWKF
jgi:hypothetical protein